jgi:hypothetical protein
MRVLLKDVELERLHVFECDEVETAQSIETINYGNGMSSGLAFPGVIVMTSYHNGDRRTRYIVTSTLKEAEDIVRQIASTVCFYASDYADRTFVDCGIVDADEYCEYDKATHDRMLKYSEFVVKGES